MRHTYYTCDRCGRSSLSTAGIVVLAAESYTQDEIDHDPDLGGVEDDKFNVHLCPICWGKVKRMIESKRVADDDVNITDGKNNVAKNYPYCHCGADMRGEQDIPEEE